MDTSFENMDSMTIDELEEYKEALGFARDYASRKIEAIQARLQGDIAIALYDEKVCERIYQLIPEKYRW